MSFPVVLPNEHVRRIVDRQASLLLLTRQLRLGEHRTPQQYDIHNGLTVRRNTKHCKDGRPDLQSDPHAFTVEITTVAPVALGEIELREARLAGYKTVEELREDWHKRRKGDLALLVFAHEFRLVEARYLHRQLHRGYTHDHRQGVEPAVDAETQRRLTELGTMRWRQELTDRQLKNERLDLHERLRALERVQADGRGDVNRELRVIRQRLQKLRGMLTTTS